MFRAKLTQMLPTMTQRTSAIPCDQESFALSMVVSTQKWGTKHRYVFGDQRSRKQNLLVRGIKRKSRLLLKLSKI